MPDETLRLRAREAIRSGRVPAVRSQRILRGIRVGDPCTICSGSVGGLGIDLEFVREGRAIRYPVHIDCFAAWESECQSDAARERPAASDPAS